MKNVIENIARQITKHRTKLGLTKKDLSKLMDVAPSTVSGWENGEYAPGADKLVKLCDLFGITIDEIYGIRANTKTPTIDEIAGLNKQEIIEQILAIANNMPVEQQEVFVALVVALDNFLAAAAKSQGHSSIELRDIFPIDYPHA